MSNEKKKIISGPAAAEGALTFSGPSTPSSASESQGNKLPIIQPEVFNLPTFDLELEILVGRLLQETGMELSPTIYSILHKRTPFPQRYQETNRWG